MASDGRCTACIWHDYLRQSPNAVLIELEPVPGSARRWEIHNGGPTGTILHGDPRNCTCTGPWNDDTRESEAT